jgi:hypothetical protein
VLTALLQRFFQELYAVEWKDLRCVVSKPEEVGRAPHVRDSVHGPKKMGEAQPSLLPFRTAKSRFEEG